MVRMIGCIFVFYLDGLVWLECWWVGLVLFGDCFGDFVCFGRGVFFL